MAKGFRTSQGGVFRSLIPPTDSAVEIVVQAQWRGSSRLPTSVPPADAAKVEMPGAGPRRIPMPAVGRPTRTGCSPDPTGTLPLDRCNQGGSAMNLPDLAERLLEAKTEKGLSFAELGKRIGRDEIWVAAILFRQASASGDEARELASALGVDPATTAELCACPLKGLGQVVPTDPLIYRFYEIMQAYGMPLKAVIHEKFGDGIMSAIDFTIKVEKRADPKGDRGKVILPGKFFP